MRILHAYPEILSKGGRPHDCRQLASYLARHGNVVAAVGLLRPEDYGRIYPDGVEVHIVRGGVQSYLAFQRVVEQFKPDVVHFTGGPRIPVQNLWASACSRLGIPYVVSACGNLSEPTFRNRWGNKPNFFYHRWMKRAYFKLFDARLIRNAALVHATSETESQIATECGARLTSIIPFGMDDRWVGNVPRPPINSDAVVTFTYLGRLSIVHKGLDIIIDGFAELDARGLGGRVQLVLAGTSENGSMEQLKARAKRAGIANVEFPGGVWGDEKERLWSRTHFFLHMCRYNGFALATREALGQCIPIVATMESDFGDWVHRYEMGAVSNLSPTSLADTVETLLKSPEKYERMIEGACVYRHDTSWESVAANLERAYREVVPAQATSVNAVLSAAG